MSTYARKKLLEALYVLVGSCSIQKRLCAAGGHLVCLGPDDFEPDDLETFEAIMKSLTSATPAAEEVSLEATTRRLTDQEGDKLADKILSLYTSIRGGI